MMNAPLTIALDALALAIVLPTVPVIAEILVLSLAALKQPLTPAMTNDTSLRIAVLIPAHNEERLIGACVASVRNSLHQPSNIYVITHNCTDATAANARAAGANIIDLNDDGVRGKGAALLHGFTIATGEHADAVLVIDADSTIASTLIGHVHDAFARGADAVQARYIAATGTTERAHLQSLALYGMNVLRPRGRANIGLSCGIFGNGFALSATTLNAVPYTAHSVVEDMEYHLMLVSSGRRVQFLDRAEVRGEMPDNNRAAATQSARWEGGRARMRREYTLPLLTHLLHGRLQLIEPLFDLLSIPLGNALLLMFLALLLPVTASRVYAGVALLAVLLYVAVSAWLSPQPASMLRAALAVPAFLLRKVLQLRAKRSAARSNTAWVRTQRNETKPEETSE